VDKRFKFPKAEKGVKKNEKMQEYCLLQVAQGVNDFGKNRNLLRKIIKTVN
jgi:hypothetical protein